jgi:hypothetical protein
MAGLQHIPIEFIPGLWVSLPEGIQGRGSGFLLAENIRSVIAVEVKIPTSRDSGRNWSIISVTNKELEKESYIIALTRIVTESWLDTGSVLILGSPWSIKRILQRFLQKTGGIKPAAVDNIIASKLG